MAQANVLTSASNVIWYTDKAEIVTGATAVTYNVYAVQLPPAITVGVTATSGSNVLVTTAQTQFPVGSTVIGNVISANTTVTGQTVGANITISTNATANASTTVQITKAPVGNLYSAAPQVAANSRQQIYVGAGNYLTITGANFTARELGTRSSAVYGVNGLA